MASTVPECHLSEHASSAYLITKGSALLDWVFYAHCCGLLILGGQGLGLGKAIAALFNPTVRRRHKQHQRSQQPHPPFELSTKTKTNKYFPWVTFLLRDPG